jgi:F0F1-type ATP synthase delta subunit
LTFAREPKPEDIEAVVRGLEAMVRKTVIATVKLDQALLGGVVAELEGKIYDGSLATRLSEAERRLAG